MKVLDRIPKPLRRRLVTSMPTVPVRLIRADMDEFLDSLPPEFRGDGEEVWAEWAEQNEELAWALVAKMAEPTKTAKSKRKPLPVSHSGDPMLEPKLSVVEAARFLGIGTTRLREIVNDGEIAFVKMGGKYLFFERDLAEFIQKRYVRSVPTSNQPKTRALPSHIANSPLLKKGGVAA